MLYPLRFKNYGDNITLRLILLRKAIKIVVYKRVNGILRDINLLLPSLAQLIGVLRRLATYFANRKMRADPNVQ
jgi:hypothetical protein